MNARLERSEGTADGALAARAQLRAARLELLRALDAASHRYPPPDAGDDRPDEAEQRGKDDA